MERYSGVLGKARDRWLLQRTENEDRDGSQKIVHAWGVVFPSSPITIQYSPRPAVYIFKRSEMPEISQTIAEQDQLIALAMEKEESRLRSFIRNHVADRSLTEDILQEVFCELIEAYRLMKPIEQVSAWMFRVARNRIVDLFRRRKTDSLSDEVYGHEDGEPMPLEDLLPSPDEGPEAADPPRKTEPQEAGNFGL
jgi:RNA polymerase sigma factor (sigma-70 family)